MAQYRDLNAPPQQTFADIVAEMQAQAKSSKTGAPGVKDLGEAGDVVWPRPDGTPVSVRDVDLELADARQRIEDAETSLAENGSRLADAEQAVQDVRDELAAIEVGEGGPLIHDHVPAPADGEGKPAGTAWLVYGQDGSLTSVWQWDGAAWEEMPLGAELIPVLDIGSGTFGDLTGSRLVVDDALSARIVQAMDLEAKKLVVTEEAVLNHATLIGQTVVDDINVQGKLIGRDGVFTGTVDFENINVTDEVLAARISGEYLYGTVIEGGEIRTGSDESRGSFLLGDRAYVTPLDGYAAPGLQVRPPGEKFIYPPGVGAAGSEINISGGRSLDNATSLFRAGPGGISASVTPRDGNPVRYSGYLSMNGNTMQMLSRDSESTDRVELLAQGPINIGGKEASPGVARMRMVRHGRSAEISAFDGAATVEASDGTTKRSLKINGSGVWATEGSSSVSLIPQVRQFQYSPLWNMDLSPSPILVQHLPGGKLCQAQARIQNLTGSSFTLPYNEWTTLNLNPIPSDLRGGYVDYIDIRLPQADGRGVLEMNYSTGSIRIRNLHTNAQGQGVNISWSNNSSIWFPMRWFSPN